MKDAVGSSFGVLLVCALTAGVASAQSTRMPAPMPSPRMAELDRRVAAKEPAAVADFWRALATTGTPIIEPYPGDSRDVLVTFVFRDSVHAHSVLVSNGVATWVDWFMRLEPIAGTDVWYKTVVLPSNVRIGYQFRVDDTALPLWADPNAGARFANWHGDALNPNVDSTTRVRGARSKFQGPTADPQPLVNVRPGIARGRLDSLSLDSKVLGQRRRAWMYTPAAAAAATRRVSVKARPPLLVLFDGAAYTAGAWVPTPTILDNMIADGTIPAIAALFVDNGAARIAELGCDSTFAAFVVTELLPEAHRRYEFTNDPKATVIGGSSHGGLAATCAALRFPNVFGNVLSQSGSYWWSPPGTEEEWLSRTFAAIPRMPIRFYLEVGVFETDRSPDFGPGQVTTNRHFRDVLRAKGYDVMYNEFPGAHEYFNWRGTLSTAIAHFFAPPSR